MVNDRYVKEHSRVIFDVSTLLSLIGMSYFYSWGKMITFDFAHITFKNIRVYIYKSILSISAS